LLNFKYKKSYLQIEMSKEVPSVWGFFFPKKEEEAAQNRANNVRNVRPNNGLGLTQNNNNKGLNQNNKNVINTPNNNITGMFNQANNNQSKMSNIDALYEEILKHLEGIFEIVRKQALDQQEAAVNRKIKSSFTHLRNRIAELHNVLEGSPQVREEIYNEIQNKINQNKEFVENVKMNQNNQDTQMEMIMMSTPENKSIDDADVQKLRQVLAGIETIYRPNSPNVRNARMNQKASRLQDDRKAVEDLLRQINVDLSIPVPAPEMNLPDFLNQAYETINDLLERKAFPKSVAQRLFGMRAGLRWAVRHLNEQTAPNQKLNAPAPIPLAPVPNTTVSNNALSNALAPAVPKALAPVVPNALAPVVPNALAPAVPNALAPTVPNALAPNAFKPNMPNALAPNAFKPNMPNTSKPAMNQNLFSNIQQPPQTRQPMAANLLAPTIGGRRRKH